MKKIVLSVSVASMLLFSGCANSSLSTSTIGTTKEVKKFLNGKVIKTEKVLVSKSMNAVLTGAGTGAVVGGVVDKTVKGALVGGVVGALVGGVAGLIANNGEEESYKTTIQTSSNKRYVAYIQKQLQLNSELEFVVRDNGKVTNVNLLTDVNNDKLVDAIDKRYFKNGVWHYHLKKYDVTVTSKKKYYYLYDLVDVTFDKNYTIKSITKLRTGVISKESTKPVIKVITKKEVVYKDRIVEKPIIKKEVVYKDRIVEKEVIKEVKIPVPVEPIKKDEVSEDTAVAKAETKTAEPKKEETKKPSFW